MRRLGIGTSVLMVAMLATFVAAPQPTALAGGGGDPCAGDVDGDGFVTVLDLIAVLQNFGCEADCDGDANGDGVVNVMDILEVVLNFGPCDGEGCESEADCDDGDPCTIDLCIAGNCYNIPHPNPNCGDDGDG